MSPYNLRLYPLCLVMYRGTKSSRTWGIYSEMVLFTALYTFFEEDQSVFETKTTYSDITQSETLLLYRIVF